MKLVDLLLAASDTVKKKTDQALFGKQNDRQKSEKKEKINNQTHWGDRAPPSGR